MAGGFHATFKPGTQINISDTLTVVFDSPKEADPVTVTLTEVDAWVGPGGSVTEGPGAGDLIAEFQGKITGGKFTGKLTKSGTSTATSPPTLKVLFDGQPAGAVQSLPIPDSTLANENGIFEVQLKVTGTIGKTSKTYTAPSPVFVRNFKAGRPVGAFVTGTGSGYFMAANDFMKTYADGVFGLGSVLEIREFLRTQSDARGYGPWGEVNIVSHGNAVEWVIKLQPADTAALHLRRWHVEDARKKTPALSTPIAAQLDASSRVVIRGCAIGSDAGLLGEIRSLFGGAATVYAPKYLQWYETLSGTAREGFYEQFFFYAKQDTSPSDAVCLAELKKKYPSSGISDADWQKMLATTAPTATGFRATDATGGDRHETIPWRLTLNVKHPATPRANASAPAPDAAVTAAKAYDWVGKARTGFNAATPRENVETQWDDWKFSEGPLQEKAVGLAETQFSKLFTGNRVRIEVRRELRDTSGTPVKPDIKNPDHYGHSP